MSLEQEFAAEVARTYSQSGWIITPSEEAVEQINFRPDLFLTKGDQHLVIEIRREGFASSRATDTIRKTVEMNANWKFDLKIIPRNWNARIEDIDDGHAEVRLRIAGALQSEGHPDEAFILSWTLIEGSLRRLLGTGADRGVRPSSTLIRDAYEEGVIIDAELRQLQAALTIRNQLVHGLKVADIAGPSEQLYDLARSIFDRVRGTALRPS